MEIICGRRPNCGFRVHSRYYFDKPKFAPRVCARCNGPLQYVDDNTDDAVLGYEMGDDGSVVHDG